MDAIELDFASNTQPLHDSPESPLYTTYTVPNIVRTLREAIQRLAPSQGQRTLILNETVTNFQIVWEHMRPEVPGNMLSSGGSSIGWSLAAAVGASLGGTLLAGDSNSQPSSDVRSTTADTNGSGAREGSVQRANKFDLVVAIVGDGGFLFGIPSSVYWMARRYNTPFLTIVLNNGGWRGPKLSMLAVHPVGLDSQLLSAVPADTLHTGFGPACPDYSQIAVAASAGWAWGKKIGGEQKVGNQVADNPAADGGKAELETAIDVAIKTVLEGRRCAVLDCVLDGI
ncbi:hypothetical protein NMY22_g15329 [Coprinellus aureogranulatus]|nr:hypothetical protein NMY22_g15329 [Coprinellus aureogranulatus]